MPDMVNEPLGARKMKKRAIGQHFLRVRVHLYLTGRVRNLMWRETIVVGL